MQIKFLPAGVQPQHDGARYSDHRNVNYERLDRHAEDITIHYTDDTRDGVRVSGLLITRIHCGARRRRDTLKTASAPSLDTLRAGHEP